MEEKDERDAIGKLITEINQIKRSENDVPRRIWMLFGIVFVIAICLLVMVLLFGRRETRLR